MSDAKIRELERQLATDPSVEEKLIIEKVKAGQVDLGLLQVAAHLGWAPARRVFPDFRLPPDPICRQCNGRQGYPNRMTHRGARYPCQCDGQPMLDPVWVSRLVALTKACRPKQRKFPCSDCGGRNFLKDAVRLNERHCIYCDNDGWCLKTPTSHWLQMKMFIAGAWAAFDVWSDVDDRDYRGPDVRSSLDAASAWLRCPCLPHERETARTIRQGLGGPLAGGDWWWCVVWGASIGRPDWDTWEEGTRGMAQGGSLIAGPEKYAEALLVPILEELRL